MLLSFLVPPTINSQLSSPSNPQVIVGKSTVVSCFVDGVSTPRIQWLFAGQPLDLSSARHQLLSDGQQLSILNTEVLDSGRYSCIAKNEAGIADRDFDLDVLGEQFHFVEFSAQRHFSLVIYDQMSWGKN